MKSQIPVSITQIKIPQLSYPSELGSLDFMISTQLCSFQCRSPRLFGYGDKKRIHELRGWVWVNTSFQRNSCFFFLLSGSISPQYAGQQGIWGTAQPLLSVVDPTGASVPAFYLIPVGAAAGQECFSGVSLTPDSGEEMGDLTKESEVTTGLWSLVITPLQEICRLCRMEKIVRNSTFKRRNSLDLVNVLRKNCKAMLFEKLTKFYTGVI